MLIFTLAFVLLIIIFSLSFDSMTRIYLFLSQNQNLASLLICNGNRTMPARVRNPKHPFDLNRSS